MWPNAGEGLRIEISVKFTRESVSHMLNEADLALLDWGTDKQGLFGLALSGLKRRPPGPTTDVLVNEFRDTNRRQLELLKRLVPSRDRKCFHFGSLYAVIGGSTEPHTEG